MTTRDLKEYAIGNFKPPVPPKNKNNDPWEDDDRSKIAQAVKQLLATGNKVDWRVPGQMGHVVRVNDEGVTMKRWGMPRSKINYFMYLNDDDDSRYQIKMKAPKHYEVVSADSNVTESSNMSNTSNSNKNKTVKTDNKQQSIAEGDVLNFPKTAKVGKQATVDKPKQNIVPMPKPTSNPRVKLGKNAKGDTVAQAKDLADIYEQQHEYCPECGGPMFSELLINEKKDACYYKVKSRYKVWPSAYASGALVKCRNKGAKNWGNKNEGAIAEGLCRADEDLHKWFKEKWVRFGPNGKIRGDCARGDDSEGKPKCLPQSKAYSLGKKGRASAAARKRRQDPNPERKGAAINVATKKKSNESVTEGSENHKAAEEYKANLLKTAPRVMAFLAKSVEGWRPSEDQMLGAIDTAYEVMKHTGDVKQAGKAMMDELNTLHKMSQGQPGVAEGWSQKYKKSINCSNPKGFSQKAHCASKKKTNKVKEASQSDKIAGRYTPDEFDELVSRVGAQAKQGPMKTVWDPRTQRYKTVPVNAAPAADSNTTSVPESQYKYPVNPQSQIEDPEELQRLNDIKLLYRLYGSFLGRSGAYSDEPNSGLARARRFMKKGLLKISDDARGESRKQERHAQHLLLTMVNDDGSIVGRQEK